MQFTHYNDDCYIEYGTRVNGPDDKWHDNTPYGRRVVSITQLRNIGRYPNKFRAAVQKSFEEDSYHIYI